MPRSSTSYRRRHRKRSSSPKASNDEKDDYYRDRNKKKSDTYYSRSSRKKSESRSQSYKKRNRRSPSTSDSTSSTNSSSKSIHKAASVEPSKQEAINLNFLEGKVNPQTLIDIEDDNFQQKVFTSTKPLQQKVIIDLQKDTITVPTVECPEHDDSIFHPNFLGDDAKKMEKWIRKLYNYRQRLVNE